MNNANLPTILVTNDDGITAPGIRALVEAVRGLGKVIVVAPDAPQSAMGHAVTIGKPLRLDKVENLFEGIDAWQSTGTPVDCVKLARDKILGYRPDFCVSGINHGANHSINVLYSGTMSAAMEAAIEGIPSIGFSLFDYSWDADFSLAGDVARRILKRMIADGAESHTLLNVNIPKCNAAEFKGVKLCRMALGRWLENFDHRKDPRGRDYYWMTGRFEPMGSTLGTDVEALEQNYASVVPIQFDLTNERLLREYQEKWNDLT
ncbi:MAG: 5'/3'-nucleotidase SurE [Sphingobacteriales bacterium]|nr:MAG: 5'/3'-nucleotidase SurE [Sphingobacteriales bacterium]